MASGVVITIRTIAVIVIAPYLVILAFLYVGEASFFCSFSVSHSLPSVACKDTERTNSAIVVAALTARSAW